MALLRYLQSKDGLPDPRGTLSSSIPSPAIAAANREIRKVSEEQKKRGQYIKYSPNIHAEIGKYATLHGVAAAARVFSAKMKQRVSETTVRSIKDAYTVEIKRKRASQESVRDVSSLPSKKRGRPLLLGQDLDGKVQQYLKKVREAGGAVSSRTVIAAARGIAMSCNRNVLAEFGGSIVLNRYWGHSLLNRMNFVQRKATTAKSKESEATFLVAKQQFLDEVVTTVYMEDIPPELILNWDQSGIRIVPSSTWTMEQRGAKRVEMIGVNDKRQITAVFCGTLLGDFLPVQLIYKGKTPRCHPNFKFPEEWHITHSPKHWSNEETMIQYINHIVLPYISKVRESFDDITPALVIMDNFKGQITEDVLTLLNNNNVHTCLLPPNTTDRLQPMDISVNKPAKDYIKQKFDEWYSEEVMKQLEDSDTAQVQPVRLPLPAMKELGAKWLVDMASYIADHPKIIVNGFIRSGITGALDGVEESEFSEESEGDDQNPESDYDEGICGNGDQSEADDEDCVEQIECDDFDTECDEELDIGYIEDPNEGGDIGSEVICIS